MTDDLPRNGGALVSTPPRLGHWQFWARGFSLVAGFAIVGTLLADPRVIVPQMSPIEHSALPLMLLGVSGAFVYGFGFRFKSKPMRRFLGPVAAWLLMAAGMGLLLLERLF